MTSTESRTTTLCAHMDDVDAAMRDLAGTIALAIVHLPPDERRQLIAVFHLLAAAVRAARVDVEHVHAAVGMLKALTHTMELTAKVERRLRESRRDLDRIEAEPLADWLQAA